MKYVGVDLHKHVIVLRVAVLEGNSPRIVGRAKFDCRDTAAIRQFFERLGRFQVVVEATAAYEWFFRLIEDLADRLVLAHPKKLRVIAESTRKSDKIDAEVLAMFLARDMIPEAYRPSPRVREHRVLVRYRCWVQRRITSIKARIRNTLAQYNADVPDLFSARGLAYQEELALSAADRFAVTSMLQQLTLLGRQRGQADAELAAFAEAGPLAEREARAILTSIPQVGPVTVDVVLSELGDWRRFRSQPAAVRFAGLDPGFRQSANRCLQLHISKEGSRLLRWALVEAAWRLVRHSHVWRRRFTRVQLNTGSKKKAIVAVARRLLCTMMAMLQAGEPYQLIKPATPPDTNGESAPTSAPARQKGYAPSRPPSRRPSPPSAASAGPTRGRRRKGAKAGS
jgi:transposase